MSSLSDIIQMIVNNSTIYCGLCLLPIEQENEYFHVHDEIIIIGKVVSLYEISSVLFGNQIPDFLSTNLICLNCTKTAINSYKFITKCKKNIQQTNMMIDCLQKSSDDIVVERDKYKSLYLAFDTDNYTVNCFYDEKQVSNEASSLERFQCLKVKDYYIAIDFEYDPNYSSDIDQNIFKNVDTKSVSTIKVSDAPYEKDENSYKCKICFKIFPSVLKIKNHYSRVHAPKYFKCTQCPSRFGSMTFLNRHIRDSHCSTICTYCGKTISNISLRSHKKTHQSHFVCQSCSRVFKTKLAFNKHVKQKCKRTTKSYSEAEFHCAHCDKKYSQKTALRVHIRVKHEEGKAVSCDWCGKKFGSISSLNEHRITHTKEKNFKCDVCNGRFVSKASLTYHMRTHTGEKPYKCGSCDMGFISASARSSHVHRHHSTELECDICYGKFKGQYCLNRHRKIHLKVSRKLTHQTM